MSAQKCVYQVAGSNFHQPLAWKSCLKSSLSKSYFCPGFAGKKSSIFPVMGVELQL